jgi:FAD/FMN-containing dehydrogenase
MTTDQLTVAGTVIGPADPAYDAARAVFLGGIDKRPALVVRAAGAADVAAVVGYARETGMDLAVRSGGHTAFATNDGGIVLDLKDLDAIDIDTEARTAWIGPGATAAAVTSALVARGLIIGFGDTGSVGVGGITLGGGVGYLVRKHGLTVDSLLAADIVTADGVLRRVDAGHEPDLFWAIRGGGGNFGAATRFLFRLHDLPPVVGGLLALPGTPEVIAGFVAAAQAAPEELSTVANVITAPPLPFLPPAVHGKPVLMADLVHAGDEADGQRVLDGFRALAPPYLDMTRPMPYSEIYPPGDPDYHPISVARTLFVDDVDLPMARTIVAHLEASDAAPAVAQIRVLGGVMARVPGDATAFAHRAQRVMVNVAAVFAATEDAPPHLAWVEAFKDALQPVATGAYVNFLNEDGPDRLREAYPHATWSRLREIKRRHDPTNVFRGNQNISPA